MIGSELSKELICNYYPMKIFKHRNLFLLFALLLLNACQDDSPSESISPWTSFSFNLRHEKFGLDVEVSLDEEGTYHLSGEAEKQLKKYLVERASEEVPQMSADDLTITFFRPSPESYADSKLTVSGWATDTGGIVTPVAVEFDRIGFGKTPEGTYGGGTVHRCLGDGCACCGFIREPSVETGLPGTANKVIGCSCDTSPGDCSKSVGPCNHWIHSGP